MRYSPFYRYFIILLFIPDKVSGNPSVTINRQAAKRVHLPEGKVQTTILSGLFYYCLPFNSASGTLPVSLI